MIAVTIALVALAAINYLGYAMMVYANGLSEDGLPYVSAWNYFTPTATVAGLGVVIGTFYYPNLPVELVRVMLRMLRCKG